MWEDDPRAMTNIRQKNAPPLTGQNRRWVLADRPVGREVRESDFALETQPIPELRDGEFLVRTLYLSVAPVMRHYMLQGGAGERPLQFGDQIGDGCSLGLDRLGAGADAFTQPSEIANLEFHQRSVR